MSSTTRPADRTAPGAAALPLDIPGLDGIGVAQFQLFNWGTFDGAVQRLVLDGDNGLLTGHVGAGKSTVVDGITTLFAAPSKVVFNRAAGADTRERTIGTYLLGYYRNVYDAELATTRPEALRDAKTAYSVLLGHFTGTPAGGTFTAGVALYFEATGSVHRMYFTAPTALDIEEHLTGHANARAVRGALRDAGAEVFDENFKNYRRSLTRALGLGPAALDLLVQTVSMKSVGNLTSFVREHMLDPVDSPAKIAGILEHWSDLTRAYELVQTARGQLERLEPVAQYAALYDQADARIAASREAAAAVDHLVEEHRVALLADAVAALDARLPGLRGRAEQLTAQHRAQQQAVTALAVAVQQGGGTDLARAEHQLEQARAAVGAARRALAELAALARTAGVAPPEGTADWPRFTRAVADAREQLAAGRGALREAEYLALRAFRDARDELTKVTDELADPTRRDSNVPVADARLRAHIAAELGLEPAALPFAAELMAVSPDAAAWEGAAERLVRPLGLSMLVAEEHYARVAAWVDANHLGRRLVYHRVPTHTAGGGDPRPGTMAANLHIRPGTPFTGWLRAEVARRYDHTCVGTAAELARHPRAVTPAGQVKENTRHEKDDRSRVGDRGTYILGWDTAARRAYLTAQLPDMRAHVAALEKAAGDATEARTGSDTRSDALTQIADRFDDPTTVDVAAAVDALGEAEELYDTIAGRPELAELMAKHAQAEERLGELLSELGKAQKAVGDAEGKQERFVDQHTRAAARLAGIPGPDLSADAAAALTEALASVGRRPADVDGCDAWGRAVTDALTARQTSATNTLSRNGQRLVGYMKDFANAWPTVVADIPAEVESRGEYLALRQRLRDDDLPSYEADFRTQLRENAIHELVTFNTFLHTESRKISGRIDTINTALADIDYNDGTYIRLEHEPTTDADVREFRAQLREITTGNLGEDETYAEERFLKVKALLDRFKGRAGSANADQAWTKKVTDVRAWFDFAASERTRDEDVPVEHYTDSGGKSGGQKEKLAYTILAASLSYQYGLAGGSAHAFRFVMIDEAFGRGSDESTRFGLELFGRLRLQLLVVTPLQKINTIAPYVQAVGYVINENPRSRLITMTIKEYRAAQARKAAARLAAHGVTSLPVHRTDLAEDLEDPDGDIDGDIDTVVGGAGLADDRPGDVAAGGGR
jgi:uncharacterized protein YPO0396